MLVDFAVEVKVLPQDDATIVEEGALMIQDATIMIQEEAITIETRDEVVVLIGGLTFQTISLENMDQEGNEAKVEHHQRDEVDLPSQEDEEVKVDLQ